ncbi:MAG: exosortase E/protease, VPEID-CTERM system [Gemmataceae bacterium]
MTAGTLNPGRSGPLKAWALGRWACLAALFLGEILFLTFRFSTGPLIGNPSPWAGLVGLSHPILQISIDAAVATLALAVLCLRPEINRASKQLASLSHLILFVIAHGLAFFLFVGLTAHILETRVLTSSVMLAWMALGLAAFALLAAAALPPPLWIKALRKGWVVGLTGVLVGAAAWTVGQEIQNGWEVSAGATLWVVSRLLSVISPVVVSGPDYVVGTSTFLVQIAPSCSGYEGMGLIAVFLAVYLWLFRARLRFPQALLLLPAGVLLVWLANAVRIASLVAVGTWVSPALAQGAFHAQLGWHMFLAVSLGLVATSLHVRTFRPYRPGLSDGRSKPINPTAAYLVPLMAVVATAMVTSAFYPAGFDPLYPLRIGAAVLAILYFRSAYSEWKWTWSWQAAALGAAAFVLWIALAKVLVQKTGSASALAEDWSHLPAWAAVGWLICRVVGSVLTVPVVEELAFRGYLTRRLIGPVFTDVPPGRFTWLSFLVSSLLFGALHGRWLAGSLAGMLYALSYYRRGQLNDAIVSHALTNALIAWYVLYTGDWALWS